MRAKSTSLALLAALGGIALLGCESKPAPVPAPASAKPADTNPAAAVPAKPVTFVTHQKENVLWVFKADSKELADFQKAGAPAVHATRIAGGKIIKAPDAATIEAFLAK